MAENVGIEQEIIEFILQRKYFYGHFLQQFKRYMVDNNDEMGKIVKTLGVNITDDLKPNLYINKAFYSSGDYDENNPTKKQTYGMTKEQKGAVLEHEILHILNKHLLRGEKRNHYVWNLANDIAINQYITGLPSGGLCPKCNSLIQFVGSTKTIPKVCPKCGEALDPDKDTFEPLDYKTFKVPDASGKIVTLNLPEKAASEQYYDILWEKMPKAIIEMGSSITQQREQKAKKGMKQGQGQGQKQDGQQQGEGEGQGDGDQEGEVNFGAGYVEINGVKIPMVFDQHEAWEAGSDNRELAHDKVKDMVEKAMHKVNEKSQGYMPGWMQALVDEVLAHKTITWQSKLRKLVGYEEFACFIPTRKRLNRRFPLLFGNKVQRKAHIVVAVDSSGSIGDDEFGKFFREIDLMRAAKVSITLVECDAQIQHVADYTRRPKNGKHKRIGYGGTDFRPVFELVKNRKMKSGRGKEEFKIKKDVTMIIYCTDGYGTFPAEKDIPCKTIWCLTPNHSDYGWNDKLGEKIIMKD
jgi:predicted metal-dependent peptidase